MPLAQYLEPRRLTPLFNWLRATHARCLENAHCDWWFGPGSQRSGAPPGLGALLMAARALFSAALPDARSNGHSESQKFELAVEAPDRRLAKSTRTGYEKVT